jgi:hypothetical protein
MLFLHDSCLTRLNWKLHLAFAQGDNTMPLATRLREYIAACFTGLWIESHEHEDALAEIARLCHEEAWRLAVWDVNQGLRVIGQQAAQSLDAGSSDPLAAIRALNALGTPDSSALLILVNFHRFLSTAEVVQALAHQIAAGKQNRTFVLVLSPVVQIPTELEKQIVVLEHDLPGREQLSEIAGGVATQDDELPSGEEAFAGLGGLDALKAFCLRAMRRCKEAICADCSRVCPQCDRCVCAGCSDCCELCDDSHCAGCLTTCTACERLACPDCLVNDDLCTKCHEQQTQSDNVPAELGNTSAIAAQPVVHPDRLGQTPCAA